MFAYRVEKRKYVDTLLKGIPGEVSDFRWNTKGHAIIYSSESRSLALHEKAGNMSRPFFGLPTSFVMVRIKLPDLHYQKILPSDLPEGWDDVGTYHASTQEIGDDFIRSEELALFVPSTIVRGELNVLINPTKVGDYDIEVTTEEIDLRLQDSRKF